VNHPEILEMVVRASDGGVEGHLPEGAIDVHLQVGGDLPQHLGECSFKAAIGGRRRLYGRLPVWQAIFAFWH
jgi:hypothetical protein